MSFRNYNSFVEKHVYRLFVFSHFIAVFKLVQNGEINRKILKICELWHYIESISVCLFVFVDFTHRSSRDVAQEICCCADVEPPQANGITPHVVPVLWIDGDNDNITLYYPPASYGRDTIKGMVTAGPTGIPVDKATWRKFAVIVKKYFDKHPDAAALVETELSRESENDDKYLRKLKKAQGVITG